jgi:hypothetical protein
MKFTSTVVKIRIYKEHSASQLRKTISLTLSGEMIEIYSETQTYSLTASSLRRPGFKLGSGHVEFLVDKVALGKVFS